MPRRNNLIRFLQARIGFNKTTTALKRKRPTALVLIATIAATALVAFSISVESRSGGWLRRVLQPETKSSASPVQGNSEAAKNTSAAPSANPYYTLSPVSPLAPIVTATKTDTLLTDVDLDTKADPGDTLRYTVVIGATGEDATGVTFTDTVDPNTAFVPGSIMTTPLARNDSYTATGNIRITVAAPGVLANDSDVDGVGPALNVTAGTFLSAQGGNVSLTADGGFTYNPAPGFEGVDSFTYTLNDGEGPSDTATVSITVSGMIWFINNNSASCLTPAAGCGRLTNPFSTLAAFEAVNGVVGVNNPAANDNIFVYESAINYVGPLTLENGQKFIGQDATATLSAITGLTPPAGSDPLPATSPGAPIVNITGNGITVAQNNILRGFTGGDATTDISGSGFGTLNVSDVTLNGNGQALNLSTGTLTGAFASISSTNSATTGISLTSVAGTLTSGSTTVTNSTGIGISVDTSSAALSFANTSSTGTGGTGISLTTNTGAITFGSLTITPDASQRGLFATNNTQTITATSGSVTTSNAVAVEITRASSTTPLAVSLTLISANGGTSGIVLTNTSGSFTVTGNGGDVTLGGNGTGGTITGMTGPGINMNGVTNISLTSMLIQSGGDDGIRGLNVNGFAFNRNRVLNNGNAVQEYGLDMTNLLGTATVNNSLVTGNAENNLFVQNGAGTLNLTTTGTTYANTSAAIGNDGIHFLMADVAGSNNANMSITVTNCIFTNHRGDHFQALTDAATTGTQTVVFQNNDLNNTVGTNLGAGLTLNPSGNATVNFNVSNNGTLVDPFTGAFSSAMTINSSGNATMSGTINNNVIGNPAVVDSGSFSADAITLFANQKSDITVAITNNRLREYSNTSGINMQARDDVAAGAGGSINATITGNVISDPGTFAGNGIFSSAGSVAGDDHFMCVDIGGAGALANTIVGSGGNGVEDFFIRQRFLTTVRLPGYAGANNSDAAVVAFIQGRNTGAETGLATNNVAGGGGGFVGGAACGTPALGPITESSISSLSASSDALTADESESKESTKDSVLWATRGENSNPRNILKLTSAELTAMAQAAVARWAEAGLSAREMAKLQGMTFEIGDLPEGQLAKTSSSKITLDETAAGYGWFFDATPSDDSEFDVPVLGLELQTTELSDANGRIDLLTVLMRQLGSATSPGKSALKGPQSWLMDSTLDTGTRRAPAFKAGGVAKVKSAPAATAKSGVAQKAAKSGASYQQVAMDSSRKSRVTKHHATVTPRPPTSFVDVMLNIGVLPAGKSITIKFDVTVDNPYLGATNQVSNQGTVSGTNFSNVLTDDPDVGGAADPTLTTIDQPDVTVAVSPASVLEDGSDNLVYTFTREGSTAANLTVNFSVGGTATFNTDYTQTGAATFNASSGTVIIPIGSATATVTLDPTTDTTVESNETAILTVISGASYDVGIPASATGTITNDDTDVTVAVSPSSVEEDGAPNLVYTFTRNGVTAGPLTVNFSVGGTATFSTDYTQTGAATFTATDGTVTFGAGNTTTTVTVDPTTDNTIEPNETVILTLAAGTGYNVAIPNTATGTITNDDAEVTLAVAPSSVDEDGATNLVYTFTRTGDISGALPVNFTISGTADPSTDYTQIGATTFTPPNGTVTFGAGNSTATVTVDPTADVTAEPNETVTFTLAAGADYNIGTPSSATGTIDNDDTTVSVAVSPLATDEDGATNLVYTFTRSDSSGALTVNFLVNGTATFNTDYTQTGAATFTPPNGTVTFADGSLTATVTVDPSADSTVEPDETVILTVAAGSGYTVGVPAAATGTITNDDTDVSVAVSPLSTTEDGAGNLVYTFTRTGVTTGAISVNFTINGTATFSTDYTQTGANTFTPPNGTVDFIAGSSTATVTVDPTADNTVEPDETVILTVAPGTGYNVAAPSAATGTITNDDATVTVAVAPSNVDEDGAINLVYTFTRTGSTAGALTVNFSVGGTADSSTDYTQAGAATFTPPTGTVTFGAGNSTAMVTIDPSADATTEADETVILTVTAGTGYEVGVPDSATGTINNDDNAVSVAVSPLAVDEDGATNLVYTFTRGDSSGELTVNFSINGTATFSTDYTQTGAATFTPPTGTVTFADGSLTATVTVDPSADSTVEPNETVILTVTAGAGYTVGVPASATGTITNDDTDVSVAVSPLSTTEDGAGNLVYTFTRTGNTTGPLSVNFSINGTATFSTDYTQTGATTFTPPTGTVSFIAGSSTAIVTVDPTADGAAELDETVILTVTAGTGYNVAAPSVATGTIVNDDTEVSVAVAPSSVLEDGAANMIFTFTRTGVISGPLTVNFSVGGTAAYAPPGGDYQTDNPLTFTATAGTVSFLAGSSTATVTADPFGDADLEPNETVILTVTAGAGYTVGSPNSATGTILNDDNSPPTVVVGYGQCGGGASTGTMNLLVGDVETPAGSLILTATSSNTAVVPLGNISFGGSGANRTVTISAITKSTVMFSDVTITVFDGTFTSSINIRVIVGTNKTEIINIGTTTVGTDMIFGGNGDDTINSGAGNDLICGGNGGGVVNGGLGDDTIDGGNGNDTLRGGDGNDLIFGGGGNDTLEGGNDNDVIDGGAGTDILRGESGDDTLTGGSGPDSFNGGPGNDTATDFNAGMGDTKDISVEIASLFGTNDWGGVLAYFASPPRWWISPFPAPAGYGSVIGNQQ